MSTTGGFIVPGVRSMTTSSRNLPTTVVEVSIKAEGLANKDLLSKSDPVCIVSQKVNNDWVELDRTEVVKNSVNPDWVKKFVVNYSFEERQPLMFEVYDSDGKSKKFKDSAKLGNVVTTLGQLVNFGTMNVDVKGGKGKLVIRTEELSSNKAIACATFEAKGLDKKDTFGKSDPFFVVSKEDGAKFLSVYKSEVIKKTLDPKWKGFQIPIRELCNADYERPIKIEVFDWDSKNDFDYIGSFTTKLAALKSGCSFNVINEKKAAKSKKYTNSGVLTVSKFEVEGNPSFLDYIQAGTALDFSVAVDFTASNRFAKDPESLHYRNKDGENYYSVTIRAVGEIVEDYDYDRHFPALGFGGLIDGVVSHDFFLNLQPPSVGPYCTGVDGILTAYFTALNSVTLHGPTNLAPVIGRIVDFAKNYVNGRKYYVQLIVTDGVISDMGETKKAIVAASKYPMSIIIVGVGNADFESMEELDSDQKALVDDDGNVAVRDIVQFVEMKKFMTVNNDTFKVNNALLAKTVLSEIPRQLVEYMARNGVKPLKA